MEQSLGFAHFLTHADNVACFVIGLMLIASVGTWYLVLTKGIRVWRMRRRSDAFIDAF